MVFISFLAASVIFIFDGLPLIKKKQWRELAIFVFVLSAACALAVCKAAGWPSPFKLMNGLFIDYGKKLFG